MMQIIEFEQVYDVNLRLKNSMTGTETTYFPNEKIAQMANVIKNENVITNAAIDLMSTGSFINPVPMREEIVDVLKKAGAYIVDAPVICSEAVFGMGQCLRVKPRIVLKPVYKE